MIATAGDALLADILANPADDGLRLIYADWCEDINAGALARFIRTQLAIDAAPIVYEIRGAAPRGERLLSGGHAFDEVWLKNFLVNHLHTFPSVNGTLTFTRGFLAEVHLPHNAWLEHGPALVRRHPIERVLLVDMVIEYVNRDPGFDGWHARVAPAIGATYVLDSPIRPPGWFPTRKAVVDEISTTALAWARNPTRVTHRPDVR